MAFGMSFFILFHEGDGKQSEQVDNSFNSTLMSLIKTSTMFVGELEFSKIVALIDRNSKMEGELQMSAYLFFMSFVFIIVVE